MKVELFPFQKKALAGLRMQSAEALGSYRRTHSPRVHPRICVNLHDGVE